MQALGVIGEPRVTPEVIRLLADPVRAVRVSAVLSLGPHRRSSGARTARAVPRPKASATTKRRPRSRMRSLRSRVRRRCDALFKLLAASSQDQGTAPALIAALGQVAESDATPKLQALCRPGSPASVREAANEAIASIVARAQASKAGEGDRSQAQVTLSLRLCSSAHSPGRTAWFACSWPRWRFASRPEGTLQRRHPWRCPRAPARASCASSNHRTRGCFVTRGAAST